MDKTITYYNFVSICGGKHDDITPDLSNNGILTAKENDEQKDVVSYKENIHTSHCV